jgi:hypothetical protein
VVTLAVVRPLTAGVLAEAVAFALAFALGFATVGLAEPVNLGETGQPGNC